MNGGHHPLLSCQSLTRPDIGLSERWVARVTRGSDGERAYGERGSDFAAARRRPWPAKITVG
jgi:hypothetical protein